MSPTELPVDIQCQRRGVYVCCLLLLALCLLLLQSSTLHSSDAAAVPAQQHTGEH